MTVTTAPALEFVGVSKTFGGSHALTNVSLQVEAGCIHALVGENGAGKSTMMQIACGSLRADSGYVVVRGQRVDPNPRFARRLGIRIVYQERQIASHLTVAENVLLGQLPSSRAGFLRRRGADSEAGRRLSELGLDLDPRCPASDLSVAEMQLVELARAMSEDARVLLLDEPTASLHSLEVERLSMVVRRLSERGLAVVWISHFLQEVFELSERATVIRDGKIVDTVDVCDTTPDKLLRLMFGETVVLERSVLRGARNALGDRRRALAVESVSIARSLENVSIQVGEGEVLGIAGGVGSGTHALAQTLAGARRPKSGRVIIGTSSRSIRSRRDAARQGVGFLPKDRKHEGLLRGRSILENLTLARVALGSSRFVANRSLRVRTRELARSVELKMVDPGAAVETLSGGNQQKVMLARWLGVGSSILVFDEPTAGVDIASRFEIYQQIAMLSKQGVTVVVVSDDYEELSLIADRVLVMRNGRVVAELAGDEAESGRVRELVLAGGK
ncbi:MAG: sugar ABC transporter ATP-binding protein [Actinomycetota bacterium]|nr:sugar ABC transporter ATP-binding protein [Actinomycetota bacterium]